MIRALLVDDHQIVRSGVRRMLEATGRFDIVGEAGGVAEALERARLLRPDVVVLDLALRDGSGLDAIADLRELGARVVILSMQDEPAYARKAFELGAQGYVVKDAADEELAGAIDAVLADRIYVHPALAARLVMHEPEDDLTERERQILRLIALGYTNQEIAGSALPERPHDRGPPPPHPRQAPPHDAGRSRALRARAPHRRDRPGLTPGARSRTFGSGRTCASRSRLLTGAGRSSPETSGRGRRGRLGGLHGRGGEPHHPEGGEHDEADAAQQQRDADDDAEERELDAM